MSFSIQAVAAQGASPALDSANLSTNSGSLDDRMLGELARMTSAASTQQTQLSQAFQAAGTNPEHMVRLQGDLAKFQIEMSVTAALARKAVAAVETLVKS